jgi:CTP:molybdopterin cytidylyltransferase MocA
MSVLLRQAGGSQFAAILLAAGYGTRLERDVVADSSGRFRHLVGLNKAMVPLSDANVHDTVLHRWLRQLDDCGGRIGQTVLVTNHVHAGQFSADVVGAHVHVVDDGSTCNADRLGAVADLQLAINAKRRDDGSSVRQADSDLLVIAGDTLFYKGTHTHSIGRVGSSSRRLTDCGRLSLERCFGRV